MTCLKAFSVALVVALIAADIALGALNEGYSRGGGGGSGGFGGSGGQAGNDGPPQPYSFEYAVQDAESGNDYSQRESGDGNTVQGEYRVLLPDGRRQVVSYSADDASGFNADVKYEGEASFPRGGGGGGNGGFRPGGGSGGPGSTGGPGVYLPPGK